MDETLEMTELTALQHRIVGEGQGGQVRPAVVQGTGAAAGMARGKHSGAA